MFGRIFGEISVIGAGLGMLLSIWVLPMVWCLVARLFPLNEIQPRSLGDLQLESVLQESEPSWTKTLLKSDWNMMKRVKSRKSIESNRLLFDYFDCWPWAMISPGSRRSHMRCNSVCKSNYKPTPLALSSLGPRSWLRWSFTAEKERPCQSSSIA